MAARGRPGATFPAPRLQSQKILKRTCNGSGCACARAGYGAHLAKPVALAAQILALFALDRASEIAFARAPRRQKRARMRSKIPERALTLGQPSIEGLRERAGDRQIRQQHKLGQAR